MSLSGAPSRLLTIALLVSACGTAGGLRGSAGPVQWEVVDMRRSVTPDSQTLRWDFVVVLKETAGGRVTFERMVTRLVPSSSHPDAVQGAIQEEPFNQVLGPHLELRVTMSNSLTFGPGVVPGNTAMRGSMARRWEFIGKDDSERPVRVAVVVTFNP